MSIATMMGRGLAAALAVLVCTALPATALPPGGAGGDTPGTAASVSPKSLAAGAVIRFSVSGFPAGETLYVKIDDGASCSTDAAQGACVYHSQKLTSQGSASGSFALPADLAPGPHWLRFLASKEVLDDKGEFQGIEGYTRRGGADFAIVPPSSPSGGSNGADGADGTDRTDGADGRSSDGSDAPDATAPVGAVPGEPTAAGASSVTAQGEVVTIVPLVEATAAPVPTPTPTPTPAAPTTAPRTTEVAAASTTEGGFPVIGVIGFAAMLVTACGVVGWSLRRGSSPG